MNDDKELNKLIVDDTSYVTKVTSKFTNRKAYTPADPKKIRAVIPGIILEVLVKKGQKVQRGDKLLILEAMKMKNSLLSQVDGTIKDIHIQSGKMVAKGELLLEFE